jgi:hypothetical protein
MSRSSSNQSVVSVDVASGTEASPPPSGTASQPPLTIEERWAEAREQWEKKKPEIVDLDTYTSFPPFDHDGLR